MNKTRQLADRGWQARSHNWIINGKFDFWQRLTSAATTGGAGNGFVADRWEQIHNGSGNNMTFERQTFTAGQTDVPNNPFYYTRLYMSTTPSSQTYNHFRQKVEEVYELAGRTMTMLAWMKCASGTETVNLNLRQFFGSGGDSSVNNISGNLTVTTSWQLFTHTVTLGSISGKTIGSGPYTGWDLQLPLNKQFDIQVGNTGLIEGTVEDIPHIEEISYWQELQRCQRYYNKSYNIVTLPGATTSAGAIATIANSGGVFYFPIQLPVVMRTTPSVTVYNYVTGGSGTFRSSTYNVSGSVNENSDSSFRIAGSEAARANGGGFVHYTADAEL